MSADSSLCLPWAQTLLDDVMEITKTSVTNWCNIVAKTGLSENLRKEWSEIFINQVTETYKEMTDEAVENQNKIINQIEILLKKSEILCKDLHIRMPQYGSQDLSLYEEFQLLENRIDEYEKMVQAQKKEIGLLVKQQSEACKLLGWKEKSIPTSPLPSKEYLEEFKRYLDMLESTKFERTENFIITKNEIVTLVEELQYNPDLDFEKLVLSTDDEKFLITDDNMSKLADFYNSLKELKQKAKIEVTNLREALESLWNILNVDSSVREKFLSKYCGHSLYTLEALKAEIKRCEVLKKANIQKFVEKLRCDLAHLWEKCHATELERENFIYFRVDHYTEDLLTLHDYEIKRLENYYKENQQLFTLIEKRRNLWEKMLRLEEKETASDRYKNRGGQLLQEERERKTLAKQIPTMEERMLELAAKYEEDNGTPFLSWGETIEAIVNRDHEEHNQNRRFKLSERKKIRDNTLTPKTNLGITCSKSTQNLALATPRLTTTKRKLMGTPMCSSKRTRILEETNARTAPPKLKINDRTVKTPRFSTERAKREAKRRRLSQKSVKKRDHTSPVSSEYYSFERDVDSKDGCRSTMGPDLLAIPLAATPQVASSNQRSPRIASKLSVAPLKLLF